MELASLFIAMLKPLLWILPLLILGGVLTSPWFKGLLGELAVRRLIARRLDPSVYREFTDVTILAGDGSTQIDHIYVSRFGVFVIETKNMKGWIFGGRNQAQWTQTFYRNKFKFQNPLRQNHRHIKTLESLLDLPFEAFKSVIVFTGDCTFKTEMPDEVCTCSDLIEYMRSIDKPILSDVQVAEACDRIRNTRMERSWRTYRDHVHSLERRHRGVAMTSGPEAKLSVPALQRNVSFANVLSPLPPGRRLSRAAVRGRDRDWGPLVLGIAVLLVLMVSCVRFVVDRAESAKRPVRQVAPAHTQAPRPAPSRPTPIVSDRPQLSPPAVPRTEAPRLRKQTPEEAREAKRRADAAMKVIEATTPEM